MNTPALISAALGLAAAVASWVLVAILIKFAPRIGLVDRPNERSLHTRVTPRGGGLGFVLVIAAILGILLAQGAGTVEPRGPLLIFLAAALGIAAVSLRDDFVSLGSGIRFFFQLAAAGVAVGGVGGFREFGLPGWGSIDLGGWGAALTIIWIVGLTNVYNFMDGIDGIAGVQGLIAGLAWALAGLWLDAPVVSLLGALLAGGCLGFLLHNWSPARIFMGDVGSAFLGYMFAVLPLLLLRSSVSTGRPITAGLVPGFALLLLWPFISDGFYTFVRRALRHEAVWKPHRSHLYQRLVQTGWTHARVSGLYALGCVLSGAAGWFWLRGVAAAALVPIAFLIGIIRLVLHREKQIRESHG
jgi:UDP-N-acetylmuramyl pentapeptide phosphotransferase/UDP-N-acetylglucosamine-1-phosphate transferase